MRKYSQPWLLALALGLAGCAGEESSAPPPGGAGGGTPPSPAPRAASAAPAPAPAPAAGAPGKGEVKAPAPAPAPAAKEAVKTSDAPPPLEPPKTGQAETGARPVKLTDGQVAKIKSLPAGEQEAALKQAVCPISGENLGSMGVPFKMSAEGQTFYLCCDGCEDKAKADPKAVLAKLGKK